MRRGGGLGQPPGSQKPAGSPTPLRILQALPNVQEGDGGTDMNQEEWQVLIALAVVVTLVTLLTNSLTKNRTSPQT